MNKLLIFLLNIKIDSLFRKSRKVIKNIKKIDAITDEKLKREYETINKRTNLYFSVICELENEIARKL